ncbi:hypothetical protein N9S75_01160 [Pelagibacteraceae bacterium]|nr:hypothetical protein [Pelagibacteraceae bacterium]
MIDKRRYALARERSNNMLDRDDTIDKFLTDRFIEIILEQKKYFIMHLLLEIKIILLKKNLIQLALKT